MTHTQEETQRKIELAERKAKQALYHRGLSNFKIFPSFSVDTK